MTQNKKEIPIVSVSDDIIGISFAWVSLMSGSDADVVIAVYIVGVITGIAFRISNIIYPS